VKITIKLFALLAKHLPTGAAKNQVEIEVAEGASVQDVIQALKLPMEHCHLVLVDGVYIAPSERATHLMKPGEALAIWPPVAGG
jgi:molybdopterin converting factor small subunit